GNTYPARSQGRARQAMSRKTASTALKAAISDGILGPPSLVYKPGGPQHAALFYDLNEFAAGLERAKQAFGKDFLHAMAMKSNPVSAVLKIVLDKGHAVECASIGEVLHALDIGFAPERIVFDSPVKTIPELKFGLEKGIIININSCEELEVVTDIMKELSHTKSKVGLRLNPLIGAGDVQALSVCTQDSKFGVLLTESSKEDLISWYVNRPWLTGVHVHIGTQSFGYDSLTQGVKCIVQFALEVNHRVGRNQIDVVDIGGGLKVNTEDDTARVSFEEYAQDLREKVPELFPSHGVFKQVITEFGHAFNTKAGWLVSRVEYTKVPSDELRVALIHFGADILLRTCYCPDVKIYQRRVEVFDSHGQPKEGKKINHNIAGPLCFSGDVIKRNILLPKVERNDYIVLHDCGANSLSLFSRHCSRQAPAVFGYRVQESGKVTFETLK
ncbi:unnamed protein product, partial [Porites lobata]